MTEKERNDYRRLQRELEHVDLTNEMLTRDLERQLRRLSGGTMRVEQEKVRAFHEKMDYPTADVPQNISSALIEQRYQFMLEELNEWRDAARIGDIVKAADGLADLLYVVFGTGVVHGIDLEPVFAEVHRSNMTKDRLDPVTKKGGKGPGYEPPRLDGVLLQQMPSFKNSLTDLLR